MKKLQTQGVHHLTFTGADRQTSIDFWEGVLGMPFIFEQPNLDAPEINHLYFDPGDGRLITVFTEEGRPKGNKRGVPQTIGALHHVAFNVSRATYTQVVARLDQRGIQHSGEVDRGFMYSVYFRDPLGLLVELASYKFEPPEGFSHADVLHEAHKIRVAKNDYNIADEHLADAIEVLTKQRTKSLSKDRKAKAAYGKQA